MLKEAISQLVGSASKIVLLSVAWSMCLAFLLVVFRGVVDAEKIVAAFVTLLTFVIGYYFGQKGGEDPPLGGK